MILSGEAISADGVSLLVSVDTKKIESSMPLVRINSGGQRDFWNRKIDRDCIIIGVEPKYPVEQSGIGWDDIISSLMKTLRPIYGPEKIWTHWEPDLKNQDKIEIVIDGTVAGFQKKLAACDHEIEEALKLRHLDNGNRFEERYGKALAEKKNLERPAQICEKNLLDMVSNLILGNKVGIVPARIVSNLVPSPSMENKSGKPSEPIAETKISDSLSDVENETSESRKDFLQKRIALLRKDLETAKRDPVTKYKAGSIQEQIGILERQHSSLGDSVPEHKIQPEPPKVDPVQKPEVQKPDEPTARCSFCSKAVYQTWNCSRCGQTFCSKHIALVDHHCASLPRISPLTPVSAPQTTDESIEKNSSSLPKHSRFRSFKRRIRSLGRRNRSSDPYGKYRRRIRIRKIHAFLILWFGSFLAGLLLDPMNAILLTFVALVDAIIVFIPLFILWWLFHRRIAGKAFAIFLVFIFAVYVYQTPASFTRSSLINDLYNSEAGALSSFYATVTANPSSSGSNGNIAPTGGSGLQAGSPSVSTTSNAASNSAINSAWVASFIASVNSFRSGEGIAGLTFSSQISSFSQTRFNTMSTGTNYEISHYGFDSDASSFFGSANSLGEVVFFPQTVTTTCIDVIFCTNDVNTPSPSAFATSVQSNDPGHWQVLTDPSLAYYGFYAGKGPVYNVDQGCPNTEIPGPNINVTQFLEQQGCTFSISQGEWLVIDMSS